jgi:hypothetical protein
MDIRMCPHCKTIARDFGLTCPRCGTDFHTIAQVRIDIDKANPIKRSRKARNLHIGNTTQLRTSLLALPLCDRIQSNFDVRVHSLI